MFVRTCGSSRDNFPGRRVANDSPQEPAQRGTIHYNTALEDSDQVISMGHPSNMSHTKRRATAYRARISGPLGAWQPDRSRQTRKSSGCFSFQTRCLRLLRRAGTALGCAVLAVGLSLAVWVGYLAETGNIHTVIPGRLYRSAELGHARFEQVITRFHIRTVINLRGADPGQPWYENELAAARAVGAHHIDLRMSATHLPSSGKLHELETVLAQAEPPILVHCQGGADRSGLVAALYMFWIAHLPAAEAATQLSFRYGHFPWLGSRTLAMDEAWRNVVQQVP